MTTKTTTTTPTHYEILSLQNARLQLTPQLLRAAYKKALLLHHPDKTPSTSTNGATPPAPALRAKQGMSTGTYTIDQIATAYATLRDAKARASYDSYLSTLSLSLSFPFSTQESEQEFRTGIETVDLDDLDLDEGEGEEEEDKEQIWYKPCRCGEERGFEVREAELEAAAENGEQEVVVGCRGCSLWLRVLFGVLDE